MSEKSHKPKASDDMPQQYDFSGRTGVRGKYYQKLREGYTIRIEHEDGTVSVQYITPTGTTWCRYREQTR